MEATIVDLRYRMNDVLKALDRNETVTVLYRGKPKGVLRRAPAAPATRVRDHAFFGSCRDGETVEQAMARIRGGRFHAL
jgi:hypothetical protein